MVADGNRKIVECCKEFANADESKTQAVKDEKKNKKSLRDRNTKNPGDSQEKEAVKTVSFYLTPSD